MMNRSVLLGLILVMLVSGCTGTGNTQGSSSGGSVVINSFSASDTDIQGSDKITLTTEIVNTGDSKARSVKISMLDLDTGVACSGSATCESTQNQWALLSGENPHSITDLSVNAVGEQALPKQYSWRVQAPKLPANLPQTYNARSRVSFLYSTSAVKQITLVSADELRRLKNNGQTLPITTTQSSNGPLIIDMTVREPVKIEDSFTTFRLDIKVSNAPNGNPFLGSDPSDQTQRDLFNLNINLPSGLDMVDTSGDCADLKNNNLKAQLSKGKTYEIFCDIKTTEPVPVAVTKTVIVNADYGYFTEASLSTPIKVTGRTSYSPITSTPTTTTTTSTTTTIIVTAASSSTTTSTSSTTTTTSTTTTSSTTSTTSTTNTNPTCPAPTVSSDSSVRCQQTGSDRVSFNWNAVTGATGYAIVCSTPGNNAACGVYNTGAVTSQQITGLSPATTYNIVVRVSASDGTCNVGYTWSSTASCTTTS